MQSCVGCDQLAVMFLQIGTYRLWMCGEHARDTQDTLTMMIEDVGADAIAEEQGGNYGGRA